MSAFSVVLALHIAAGSSSLLLLWIPLVAKKGGATHRRVGWIYVGAMSVVSATALALCAFRLTNGDPKDDFVGYFLGHVSLLTAKNVYSGMRALRHRKVSTPVLSALDLAVPIGLALSSVAMILLGISTQRTVAFLFAFLGLFSVGPEMEYLLRSRHQRHQWLYRHLVNMVSSGIAAITAFGVVNAHRFGFGPFNPFIWFSPGLLGGVAIAMWIRHYRRLHERAGSRRQAPVIPPSGSPRHAS